MHRHAIFRTFDDPWSVLALVRFALASIVVFSHLGEFTPLGWLSVFAMFGAFEAILGFLLISGFSIGASYQKEADGFLGRRIRRIYPVYLASMVIVGAVSVLLKGRWPGVWEVLVNALFLNQIVTSTSFVGPAWSLSLEFWLYALTPLLFMLSDKQLQRLVAVSFLAFCVYTCGRTLFDWKHYAGVGHGLNLLLLSFIWLAGLRLARLRHAPRPALRMVGAIFCAHILLTLAIWFGFRLKNGKLPLFFQGDIGVIALQAATLAIIFALFVRLMKPGRQGTPSHVMRWLGDVSFPLYLVHFPVFEVLRHWGVRSPLVYYGGAVAVAALVYRVVDVYSQRRPADVAPAAAAPSLGRKVSATVAIAAVGAAAIFAGLPQQTHEAALASLQGRAAR